MQLLKIETTKHDYVGMAHIDPFPLATLHSMRLAKLLLCLLL
jgi:hypothetical protein